MTHKTLALTIPPSFPEFARRDGGIWVSRRHLCRKQIWESDAISAGFDGAVFKSGMSRARALAARRGNAAGNLQQLRCAVAWCAAAAAAKIPDEAAATKRLQAELSAKVVASKNLSGHEFSHAAIVVPATIFSISA